MLLPKRAGINLRSLSRATRCFSTTAARPLATPTNQHPSSEKSSSSGAPVEDIDLVFDYPTEGQASHQKQPLESQGLDYHSALPHRPKADNLAGKMGKEMGATDSNVKYVYCWRHSVPCLGMGERSMCTWLTSFDKTKQVQIHRPRRRRPGRPILHDDAADKLQIY